MSTNQLSPAAALSRAGSLSSDNAAHHERSKTPLGSPLRIETMKHYQYQLPPGWNAAPFTLPPAADILGTSNPTQYSLFALASNHSHLGSPNHSPVASSAYSGYATTPGSDVSAVSSTSSYASEKRMSIPMNSSAPSPTCAPYPGFWPAPAHAPLHDAAHHHSGAAIYPNSGAPLLTAPLPAQFERKDMSYFDFAPSPDHEEAALQTAIAQFDRLFGNWRLLVDGGGASEPHTAGLRCQMDAAYARMIDVAADYENTASQSRENRKRNNSITSTPNPTPPKSLRRDSIAASTTRPTPPPLIHAHTSPVIPLQPHAAASVPAFAAKAMSATPAGQAIVDGIHFSTGASLPSHTSTILPQSVNNHPPHTPSPLSAGILAPVLQQAETSINTAIANGPPNALSAPTSPHLRSELAQAYLDSNISSASPAGPRQPQNPRAFMQSPHPPNEAIVAALPNQTGLHKSFPSQSSGMPDFDDDGVLTPPRSPRDVDGGDEDDQDMALDAPAQRRQVSSEQRFGEYNALTVEAKEALDRHFVIFLNRVCSDPQSTDSKGEPLHQPLMASKMQKLTEAGGFRPFKLRIQAFTNAFFEHLERSPPPTCELSFRVVRQYLWQQPLISRFNDEGRKSKSKGNHIWTVEAKAIGDNVWDFREFPRRIVLPPHKPAIPGQTWSWTPRIWDPQGMSHFPIVQAAPLPPWLSWHQPSGSNKVPELCGVVPLEAEGISETIKVIATFEHEGNYHELRSSFRIHFAPPSSDILVSRSRANSVREIVRPAIPVDHMSMMPSAIALGTMLDEISPSHSIVSGATDVTPTATQMPVISSHVPVVPPLNHETVVTMQGIADTALLTPSEVSQSANLAGVAPSALTAAAAAEPSLGDLLSPINLLKEEMESMDQRPGPIESAVMRHAAVQETLAAGPPIEIARHAMNELTHAQHQVSQAVSAAQGKKLDELLPQASYIAGEDPVTHESMHSGIAAPPPTPVVELPANQSGPFMTSIPQ